MNGQEKWLWVQGFEGKYKVSNEGRVLSFCRRKPHILKPQTFKSGYLYIQLWESNKHHAFLLHRLVLQTFLGKAPEGKECAHLNGDRKDNRLENLMWCTPEENEAHKIAHGTNVRPKGSLCGSAKLTEADIPRIFAMHNKGLRHKEIARKYRVSRRTISDVVNRKTWRHVSVG